MPIFSNNLSASGWLRCETPTRTPPPDLPLTTSTFRHRITPLHRHKLGVLAYWILRKHDFTSMVLYVRCSVLPSRDNWRLLLFLLSNATLVGWTVACHAV